VADERPAGAGTLFTVGHSTLPIGQFLALLRSSATRAIADVRRFPGSRRNPQFGVAALAQSLAAAGITYLPFGEELGGRRQSQATAAEPERPAVDNSAWTNASFRAYADYMQTKPFEQGLERLETIAREQRTAVMCAEAHPSRCHRRLIADAMTVRGWRVFHLLPGRAPEEHTLSPHARVEGGRLAYPGEGRAGERTAR
jgi:uncharacterized protein (DUF488 family)